MESCHISGTQEVQRAQQNTSSEDIVVRECLFTYWCVFSSEVVEGNVSRRKQELKKIHFRFILNHGSCLFSFFPSLNIKYILKRRRVSFWWKTQRRKKNRENIFYGVHTGTTLNFCTYTHTQYTVINNKNWKKITDDNRMFGRTKEKGNREKVQRHRGRQKIINLSWKQ